MRTFPATALFLLLVIVSNLHFSASKPSGFGFKLIPRDSPDSPLYPGNLTHSEKLQRLVKFSKAKANYVNFLSTTQNTALAPNKFFAPVNRDDSLYYVGEVGIGTPPKSQWLMIDTGSGLIWTQCEPCKSCFHQNYPLYDSTASTSYKKLPCSHPICSGATADRRFRCYNGECIYAFGYGSGDVVTEGIAARESFVFKDFNRPSVTVNDIIFGCSRSHKNILFGDRGLISGIIGLDLERFSLTSQLSERIQSRFSYCMAPFAEGLQHDLYLRFGEDVPRRSAGVKTTPLVFVPGASYYLLNLKGISVGSNRLNLPTDVFRAGRGGDNGFFIDSGAPVTVIATKTNGVNAYQVVMKAFEEHYKSAGLQRKLGARFTRGYPHYGLCYHNKRNFDSHPTMTYHFEGADYVVDSKYVTVNFREQNYFCVTIVPGDSLSILGGYHQQNMRIIHDGNLKALQFYPENCAEDHMP